MVDIDTEALKRIQHLLVKDKTGVVYVAQPYSKSPSNAIKKILEITSELSRLGYAWHSPILNNHYTHVYNVRKRINISHDQWVKQDLKIIQGFDDDLKAIYGEKKIIPNSRMVVLFCEGYQESSGCFEEWKEARKFNMLRYEAEPFLQGKLINAEYSQEAYWI